MAGRDPGVVASLSGYVLGVTPEEPGFKRWRVKPMATRDGDQAGNILWARGEVPVPGSRVGEGIRVVWWWWERRKG